VITVVMLTVAAILVGSALELTSNVAKNTNRSRSRIAMQAEAEGAVEYAYAIWYRQISVQGGLIPEGSPLLSISNSYINVPLTSGNYVYSGSSGGIVSGTLQIHALDKYGQIVASGSLPDGVIGNAGNTFNNWAGTTYSYAATAGLKLPGDPDSQAVNVRRLFTYTVVTPFQTMFFFQHDLEIYNPANIVLTGKIHSNGNLYFSGGSGAITIKDATTTAGTLPSGYTDSVPGITGFSTAEPPLAIGSNYDQGNLSPPNWANGTTTPGSQLNEVHAVDPLGTGLTGSASLFSGTTSNIVYNPNVDNLSDPLAARTSGTYSNLSEILQPFATGTTAASSTGIYTSGSWTEPSSIGNVRFMNNAGLIILINGTSRSGLYITGTGTGTAKATATNSYMMSGSFANIIQYSASDIAIVSTTTTAFSDTPTVTSQGSASLSLVVPPVLANVPVLVAGANGTALPIYNTSVTAASQSLTYKNAVADLVNVLNEQLATDGTKGTTAPVALYDQRVGTNVNVVNVNMAALNNFLNKDILYSSGTVGDYVPVSTANTGTFNGQLYIYDSSTSSYANTVRLVNGNELPGTQTIPNAYDPTYNPNGTLNITPGLTLVSQNPIYIMGDYNSGYKAVTSGTGSISTASGANYDSASGSNSLVLYPTTTGTSYTPVPSAVIGDAIMLLSNAWSDSNSPTYSKRNASNTTINTALMGGYMPSVTGSFSGGAVNYPRFLENWGSKYLTYWGSMVELFPSRIFTQRWQIPGTYYSPPTRYYNYDTTFNDTPPPGTALTIIRQRGAWTKF